MISIISLNWNTTNSMIRLYNSILQKTANPFDFLIVDNGSRESEYQSLETYFKDRESVFVFRNEANMGFAAGNNVGIRMIKQYDNIIDYIIFINSDIIIEEQDWDKKFIELLNDEYIGVVGCAYHPLTWTKDGHFQIQKKSNFPVDSESVQGAFFGTRFNILSKLKARNLFYFDEGFKFAHYEETDLCFRIMDMGYRCVWFPLKHTHDHANSATKLNGYNLCSEIQNENQFKINSENNRLRLLEKHRDFFDKK